MTEQPKADYVPLPLEELVEQFLRQSEKFVRAKNELVGAQSPSPTVAPLAEALTCMQASIVLLASILMELGAQAAARNAPEPTP